MKLKYYMRGIGIGVVVTTIILVVTLALTGNNISDDEVIARAKKLGMVEADSSNTTIKNKASNTTNEENQENGNQTIEGATNPMPESTANTLPSNNQANNTTLDGDSVVFTINTGESSRLVVERLAEAGLISDAYAFNNYVNGKGIDGSLQPGTFKIKRGISEDDLSNLLITKQQFREGV